MSWVTRRFVRQTAGRRKWQVFYAKLHRMSLAGRNIGEGSFEVSGEIAVLDWAARTMPEAKVVVDVGANMGGWAMEAARRWPSARVFAFEPSASTFKQLVERAGSSVTCVQSAIGDTVEVARLHQVPGVSGLSSLYARDLADHSMEMSVVEEVPVTTLDAFAAERGITHIDFLKIDAEGHDLAVLRGAKALIDGGLINMIQFEFGGANIDSRTYLRDFVRLLESHYQISRMLIDGLEPLAYSEREEIFVTTNFIATLD